MTWRNREVVADAQDPEVTLEFNAWRGLSGQIQYQRTLKNGNVDDVVVKFPQLSLMGLKCIAESLNNILCDHEEYVASIRNTIGYEVSND